MNAYEGKAGESVRTMPESYEIPVYIVYKRRYINTLPFHSLAVLMTCLDFGGQCVACERSRSPLVVVKASTSTLHGS